MFYTLRYTNEEGLSIEFKASRRDNIFVSPDEPMSDTIGNPYKLMRFEGFGEVDAEIQLHKSPNQDGRTHTSTTLDERYPYLQFILVGKDWDELSTLRRYANKVFNPRLKGVLELYYGTRSYAIDIIPEGLPRYMSEDKSGKTQVASLYLVAPNPYWRYLKETKKEIALWRGTFSFPLEIIEDESIMGYREPSMIVNVFNGGDVECGMTVEFRALATVVNPNIYQIGTTKMFKMNTTMQSGDIITVTTHFQNKRIELLRGGVVTNIFNWIDAESSFLQLEMGDNLLRYDADEGIDNLEVSIYYNPQFLGV